MDSTDGEFLELNGLKYIDTIANGGYGVILLVYSIQYQQKFALKKIPNNLFRESELECLKHLDDIFIVNLYKYYRYKGRVYLLMEYCPNDLDKLISQHVFDDQNVLKHYVYDVIQAVKACHDRNIAHSDIKPSNFLIDQYGRLKISDFGLSTIFHENASTTICKGTRLFMAPELFEKKMYNPFAADIWALGITIFNMATQEFPYSSVEERNSSKGIYSMNYITDIKLRKLVMKCLETDPAKRPKVDDLLSMNYFEIESNVDSKITLRENYKSMSSNNFIIRPSIFPKIKAVNQASQLFQRTRIQIHPNRNIMRINI